MRRLSAFLMIAALVAVLVPSVASAGKQVPRVTRILASANLISPTAEHCGVQVTVNIDGRAYQALISQYQGGTFSDVQTGLVNNRDHSAYVFFTDLALGASVYNWTVQLQDRKGNSVGTMVSAAEAWTDTTACPASGTAVVNHYPAG